MIPKIISRYLGRMGLQLQQSLSLWSPCWNVFALWQVWEMESSLQSIGVFLMGARVCSVGSEFSLSRDEIGDLKDGSLEIKGTPQFCLTCSSAFYRVRNHMEPLPDIAAQC